MYGIENLWLFVVSGIILNILPGPDSLYIMGRGATQGFRAGSIAAFGIGAGVLIHMLAAAFGLSAILATSVAAFTAVKIVGCVYLVYMGLTMIFGKSENRVIIDKNRKPDTLTKVFYKGFLTNVLNPKVALFFLAFMPQFIANDSDSKAIAFIILGLIFSINGMIWCQLLAWFSSAIGSRFKHNEKLGSWLSRGAGSLFVYFGLRLGFTAQN